MKTVRMVSCLLISILLVVPAVSGFCESSPPGNLQQNGGFAQNGAQNGAQEQEEKQIDNAFALASKSLCDAMQALGEAGRLTLDQQLPKLKEQTDAIMMDTQELLNKWEGQLRQEFDKREKGSESQPPVPGKKPLEVEVSPSI